MKLSEGKSHKEKEGMVVEGGTKPPAHLKWSRQDYKTHVQFSTVPEVSCEKVEMN